VRHQHREFVVVVVITLRRERKLNNVVCEIVFHHIEIEMLTIVLKLFGQLLIILGFVKAQVAEIMVKVKFLIGFFGFSTFLNHCQKDILYFTSHKDEFSWNFRDIHISIKPAAQAFTNKCLSLLNAQAHHLFWC